MKCHKALPLHLAISAAAGAVLLLWPAAASTAPGGSDSAFNSMVSEMAGRDTGSMWFDYYVESVNQDIAAKSAVEPFGVAGPNGPVAGFDGYVSSFYSLDTGSIWFNNYVDSVNRQLREKENAVRF